jgi:hypothetical protein
MRRIQPDLFLRKVVITISPWAVPVLAGGVIGGIAIPVVFDRVVMVISFTITLFALIQILLARKMLKQARWDIHRMLRDIGNEDIPDDAEEAPPIRILKFPGKRTASRDDADSVSG